MAKYTGLLALVASLSIAYPGLCGEASAHVEAALPEVNSDIDGLADTQVPEPVLVDSKPVTVPMQTLWPTVPPRSRNQRRVGVRAAYRMTSAGEMRDASAGALAGAYVRLGNGRSKLAYEIGLDAYAGDESDGYRTQPLGARAEMLISMGKGALLPYVNVGLAGIHEQVEDTLTGESFTNYAAAANLGVGVGLLGGRLEVRLVHSLFLASENVSGKTMLAVGYGF